MCKGNEKKYSICLNVLFGGMHSQSIMITLFLTASLVFIVDSPEDIFNWLEGHVSLTENEEHLQLEGIVPLSQETWYGCQGI